MSSLWGLPVAAQETAEAEEERGFSYQMTGTVTLLNGDTREIDMPFEYTRSGRGWYFRAGGNYMYTDSVPSAYYLSINLDDRGHAHVGDFDNGLIRGFSITLNDRQIELMQASESSIQYGMRLRIDERQLLFENRHPRVRIELSEDGIENIVSEGTLRDLSTRRTQQDNN
ncbi:hypothetical protein ACR0ST_03085 [Aliidiomarina sp. Khilg15.8]